MSVGRIQDEQHLQNWIIDRFPQLSFQAPTAAPGPTAIPGEIKLWPTATAPDGFLICDGSAYDSGDDTYSSLYGVLGTTFNTGGEAAGFFRVPDFQGRVPVGLGTHADVNAFTDNDGLAVGLRTPKHSHHKGAFSTGAREDFDLGSAPRGFRVAAGTAEYVATQAHYEEHFHNVAAIDTDTAAPPYQTVAVIIAL